MSMGASPSSGSPVLSRTMPWEWILDNCLDLKDLSLDFLEHLIKCIPHIEEPRCSRLLQKAALRYLAEAVEERTLIAGDAKLIRFVIKEEGVTSDLHRIHSLKESFELDLILRIETEAVLRILRDEYDDAGKKRDAFELAVWSNFPPSSGESRSADRREELLASLPCQPCVELRKDRCDQLLRKYSLEELLKDIAQFVEDRKKRFTFKFLDQVAKDVKRGAYNPLPAISDFDGPGVRMPPFQRADVTLSGSAGPGKRVEVALGVENPDVSPGESFDRLGDPNLNPNLFLEARTGNPGAHPQRVVLPEKLIGIRERFERAGEGCQVNDKDAVPILPHSILEEHENECKFIRNGLNEIVKSGEKICGMASISTFSSDRNKFAAPIPGGSSAHGVVQTSQPVPSNAGFDMVTDGNQPGHDYGEARNLGDIRSTSAQDWMEGYEAGKEREVLDGRERARTRTRARVSKGSKRVTDDSTGNFKTLPKKAKYNDEVNSGIGNSGVRFQEDSPAKDPQGSKNSHDYGHGEDILEWRDDKSVNLQDISKTHRTRVYLSRASKDRTATSTAVDAASDQEAGAAISDEERPFTFSEARSARVDELEIRGSRQGEYLACDQRDDARQGFCHGCLVPAHECCLLKFPVTRGLPSETCKYCFPCASRIAKERLGKAEEAEKAAYIAEEHVKVVKAALKEAEENFKNAREMSGRAKEDALEKLACLSSGADQELCEHRRFEKDFGRERRMNFENPRRMSKASSHSMQAQSGTSLHSPVECKEGENPVATETETVELSTPEKLVSSPANNIKEQVSVRHPTPEKESRTIYGSPQGLRREGLIGTGGYPSAGLIFAPEVPGRTQLGAGDPTSSVLGVEAEQFVDRQSRGMSEVRRAKSPEGPSVETVPVTQGPNLDFTRASAPEGRNEGERDGVRSSIPVYPRANRRTSQTPQSDIMDEVEVEVGDVHGGVVEEGHDKMAANVDQSERTEQPDDEVSDVPEAKPRPRRGPIYRPRGQIPGVRRKHLPWTPVEEDTLRQAVMMFSNGGEWGFQWKRILEVGSGKFHDSRTAVDLKDKWRNMKKSGAA